MPASPLSSFRDYTIIHPTREAEEDTWAGEAASKNTVQALSFPFMPLLGQRKFRIGRAVHVSAYTQGQSQDVRSVVCCTVWLLFCFSLLAIKAVDFSGDGSH